eukprot:TRINITY_DN55237_c0_g1_i1.p1 TRINITY_DN55237_c0_g1~~TRINITY_DN55237_c0_g1_i1.p1  ORF type:complete len:398 (-),score=53.15 TRINITY_DN55237_c0_g1_i1:114-1307(-)
MAENSAENVPMGKKEDGVWRHYYAHYKDVRIEMQMFSVVLCIALAATEVYLSGEITRLALFLLSLIPVHGLLAQHFRNTDKRTERDIEEFDLYVLGIGITLDVLVVSKAWGDVPHLFATCMAYIPVTFVHFQTSRISIARIYMLVHSIAVLFMFNFDVENFVPFLCNCSLLTLFHGRLARTLGEVAKDQVNATLETEKRAESLIDALITGFCDASFSLDHKWRLAHVSASLATLLGRQKVDKGIEFESFIDDGDREEFRRYMDTAFECEPAEAASGNVDLIRLRSVRVHLYDVYNMPFPVHVFSVSLRKTLGEEKHMVGISEAYQAPASAPKRTRKRIPMTYSMTTGKLEPAQKAAVEEPEVLLSNAARRANLRSSSDSSARKRDDSPRPNVAKKKM